MNLFMDYIFLIIFLIILLYSFFAIKEDIASRKVRNSITLSFLGLSFVIFLYFIRNMNLVSGIFLIISIGLSYFAYKKGIWGAADGKIFIAIALIFLSYLGFNVFFNYLVNLVLLYSISIIFLTQVRTSLNDKKAILKKIDYGEIYFAMIFSFIIASLLLFFAEQYGFANNILLVFALVIGIMWLLQKVARKFYNRLENMKKIFLNFALTFFFLFLRNFSFQYYFIIFYFFKILIEYVSELSSKITHSRKGVYESPFMVYLFIVALITMMIKLNLILLIASAFL